MEQDISLDVFGFPCGERHVRLRFDPSDDRNTPMDIHWNFENDSDNVMELLLIADAIKRAGYTIGTLRIPYFPYSRQDRVAVPGEPLSVAVMANLVNGLNAQCVEIMDPHSDVTPALLHRCRVIEQHEIFGPLLREYFPPVVLICPDSGALKKIRKLEQVCKPVKVVECSKVRNVQTGEITGTLVNETDLHGLPCVIVDDICDGGRTFTEIATILKKINAGEITLMITHGFFTKGLGVFDGLIDHIYTRKGQVK